MNPNSDTKSGVAFFDVDSGNHTIDANFDKYVSSKPTSIDVTAGQTYYFKVTQNMGNRITGKVLFIPSSLLDKATGTNPFPITPLTESEGKQEIKNVLKSKELKDEIATDNKPIASKEVVVVPKVEKPVTPKRKVKIEKKDEIAKPNISPQTNSETKANSSNSSEYAQKLRELKNLKDEGLLTDKEYELKRKAIVDGI